jgi:hypothetical protein
MTREFIEEKREKKSEIIESDMMYLHLIASFDVLSTYRILKNFEFDKG